MKKYENTYINICRYKYIVYLYTDVKFQVVNTLVQIWAVKLSRQGVDIWHFPPTFINTAGKFVQTCAGTHGMALEL